MRFDTLNLLAFGPFTSCKLSFQKSRHDLHVIHGPNEAGKSSLLRAIHHLLYGFPSSTPDDFIHEYRKLRIGATVSDGDNTLTFLRKKGNRGTLLDADENSIDEGKLRAFCGSVGSEFFLNMFGLNTDALRAGASKLLSGEGELGVLLFSASAGGSPIDSAISKLQAESDKLFVGNGRKANSLVTSMNRMKDHDKQLRANSISTAEWKKHRDELESAEQEFTKRNHALTAHRLRENRVNNILQAIPVIKTRNELKSDLDGIQLPDLPSDFRERVTNALKNRSEANSLIAEDKSSLQSKRERLESIAPFEHIVDDAPEIDSLHRNINQHVGDLKRLKSLKNDIERHTDEQHSQLVALNVAGVEELEKLPSVSRKELEALLLLDKELSKHELEVTQNQKELDSVSKKLNKQKAKLKELGEHTLTATFADLNRRVKEHNQNLKVAIGWKENCLNNQTTLTRLAKELGVSELEPSQIRSLKVPSKLVVEELHESQSRLLEERKSVNRDLDEFLSSELDLKSGIAALTKDVSIFTTENLKEARASRDAQWSDLEIKLRHRSGVNEGEPESFREKIDETDRISDNLRNHAKTLGELSSLENQLHTNREKQAHSRNKIKRVDAEISKHEKQWNKVASFHPFCDFTATELLAWLTIWGDWLNLDEENTRIEQKLSIHEDTERELTKDLEACFPGESSKYTTLAELLNMRVIDVESKNGQREMIRVEIESLEVSKVTCSDTLAQSQKLLATKIEEWGQSTANLLLPPTASRARILKLVEDRSSANQTQREIMNCKSELEEVRHRVEMYETKIRGLRIKHLPDSPEFDPLNPEIAEERLANELADAKTRQTEAGSLRKDVDQLEDKVQAKQHALAETNSELQQLSEEAKLTDSKELPDAITQFEKRNNLQEQLELTNKTLTNLAGSLSLNELINEANGEDSDALKVEQDGLTKEGSHLEAQRDAARDALNKAKSRQDELSKVKDDAALEKQYYANAHAQVVTESERFIRLQHAITFLKKQVEEFRKKTQGPMIEKTSEFFKTLTGGAFVRVSAQHDDNDPQIVNLVAIRAPADPSSEQGAVLATHELSEGTRDQLYLALRMAAIDLHLDHHAPMPLILDDVLMTFDEKRSNAFFELVKKMSEKTQVIVFTHHSHIATMAGQYVPDANILSMS